MGRLPLRLCVASRCHSCWRKLWLTRTWALASQYSLVHFFRIYKSDHGFLRCVIACPVPPSLVSTLKLSNVLFQNVPFAYSSDRELRKPAGSTMSQIIQADRSSYASSCIAVQHVCDVVMKSTQPSVSDDHSFDIAVQLCSCLFSALQTCISPLPSVRTAFFLTITFDIDELSVVCSHRSLASLDRILPLWQYDGSEFVM